MFEKLTYLDHAATTPVDSRVRQAMMEYFSEEYGNPSSVHRFGQRAEAAVETSRERIAAVLSCQPDEIIFTSCGTESDNLALRGAANAARQKMNANHILVSAVEHPAIIETALDLRDREDYEVELIPVSQEGTVEPDTIAGLIRPNTAVVSVMYANNEIGTINAITEIATICRQHDVVFHTDAVQAASQLPLSVEELGVDLMSLGAHKFYGPKGIGALYHRQDTPLQPTQTGGSQEFGLRAGTQNVPYIVGMAEALELTEREREEHNSNYRAMRDQLLERVPEMIPGTHITGHPNNRLPNHASFAFDGVDGNALLAALDLAGFACSSGSACKTGDPEPSKVLLATGMAPDLALGSLRVTVGRQNRPEDIDRFLSTLPEIVERVRAAEKVPS